VYRTEACHNKDSPTIWSVISRPQHTLSSGVCNLFVTSLEPCYTTSECECHKSAIGAPKGGFKAAAGISKPRTFLVALAAIGPGLLVMLVDADVGQRRYLRATGGSGCCRFYGTFENAVKTQIWIAVSIYVLVAIVRIRLRLEVSLYRYRSFRSRYRREGVCARQTCNS